MKKKSIIIISILIVIILIFGIISIKGIEDNKKIEQEDISNEDKLKEQMVSDINLDKVIGMDINDAKEYLEKNGLGYTISSEYNIIETEDETLYGKIKGYYKENVKDYRVTYEMVCFDVYGKSYSEEEKQKLINDIVYRIRYGYSINSSNLTKKELINLLSSYGIKYEESYSYIGITKDLLYKYIYEPQRGIKCKDDQGRTSRALSHFEIDINTFDLNTIYKLKDGVISSLYIKDLEGNKSKNEYKEGCTVVFTVFNISDDEFNKIYAFLENMEELIPKEEFIYEDIENNLPISLNTRYMFYKNRLDIGVVSTKSLYFTGNNKVLIDCYELGMKYMVGTYSIENDMIIINIDRLIYNEHIEKGNSVLKLKILDKNILEVYSINRITNFDKDKVFIKQ